MNEVMEGFAIASLAGALLLQYFRIRTMRKQIDAMQLKINRLILAS